MKENCEKKKDEVYTNVIAMIQMLQPIGLLEVAYST